MNVPAHAGDRKSRKISLQLNMAVGFDGAPKSTLSASDEGLPRQLLSELALLGVELQGSSTGSDAGGDWDTFAHGVRNSWRARTFPTA